MAIAAVLALTVFAGSEWIYQRSRDSMLSLGARDNARTNLQTVMRRLLDMETAQRGYLLTGRPQYLEPYNAAESDVSEAIEKLRQSHQNDPDRLRLVEELQEQTLQKASEAQATIALYNQGSHAAWQGLLLSDIGREKMENARRIAGELMAIEDSLGAVERAGVYRTLDVGRLTLHGLTALCLLAYLFFLSKTAALNASRLAHARQLQAERDSLERQVRQRTDELAQLNLSLQEHRDGERSGLARTLHDDLGALLTTAKLDLTRLRHALPNPANDVAMRLTHLGDTLDQGIEMKRGLMQALMPGALHNLGLQAAIEERVREFQQRTGVTVYMDLQATEFTNASTRQTLFSVLQSAMSNIEQHAHATRVSLSLVSDETDHVLKLTDNGEGFAGQPASSSAQGLKNLRHRIESLGGRLSVQSTPGEGTELLARLPVQRAEVAPSTMPS